MTRSVEHRRKLIVEGLVATTGAAIGHGTHIISLPGIFEAGRIYVSSVPGFHQFTTLGVYGCYEIELCSLLYATPFRVTSYNDTTFEDGPDSWWNYPCAQVVFRGEETAEGARAKNTRSMGEDAQHIYPYHQERVADLPRGASPGKTQ